MYNQVSVDAMADSYKVGMASLHSLTVFDKVVEIISSYSNFTPRKNAYMQFSEFSDEKLVVYGTRDTFLNVDRMFRETFFNVNRNQVMKKLKRRTLNHFGSIEDHTKFLRDMGRLHDLGVLPLEVMAIDEGTRYPIGLPLFTVKATVAGYGWLVNFIETLTSGLIWPMINTAAKVEQFYLQARHYGSISAPKDVYESWLPICVHEFGMRGYRGPQDQVRTSSASNLFFIGSDTQATIDFFEDSYDADSDKEVIAVSVRATEHADISRMLSLFRHININSATQWLHFIDRMVDVMDVVSETELYVLEWFVRNSTGIMAYVSDTEDYYRLIDVYARKLKDKILNRSDREDGQPAKFTFRPDSSRRTPLTVICGFRVLQVSTLVEVKDPADFAKSLELSDDACACIGGLYYLNDGTSISKAEAMGSLNLLWDIFGGTEEITEVGKVKLIDPRVGLIYGEAISQTHQVEIYERMIDMGFSATNIIIGKGSYASLEGNTRDLFAMAYKQTFSDATVDGVPVKLAQQKNPMGDSTKKSARGLLCVSKSNGEYVLEEDVTELREQQGELTLLYRNGVFYKKQTLIDIKETYQDCLSEMES